MPTHISDGAARCVRLEEILGPKHARTLMTDLPPQPGADMATKGDVAVLEQRFDRLEGILDRRLGRIDARLGRMDRRFEVTDDRLHALQDCIRDQLRTCTVTMIGGITALTAIYAALLAFVM